ncbi:MAG: RING finger protein [Pirellulaceae bacterium]
MLASNSKGPLVTLLAQDGGLITMIVTVAVVVLIAMAVIAAANAAHKRDASLDRLARRLGGKVQPGGLIAYPELRFPHGGRTATLKYTAGGENESPRTYLTIPWPHGRLRSEIFMEGPLSPLRKLIGMQDIEIGSPQFDRQFIITGNDEAAIKAFLTPDAQDRLFDLLRLDSGTTFSAPGLYLQIAGGMLTVTKASYLSEGVILERFIRLFLQFFDAATSVPSAGIEFLGPAIASHSPGEAAPHCVVCGEPLATDLVSCRSCRTPHHRECWQYFGGCATYACGGKQHVPAKASGRR